MKLMFTVAWFKDTIERVLKTTIQAFVAALILAHSFGLDAVRSAAIAGIAAGLGAFKALVAVFIPSNVSPASWATGRRRYVVDIVERLLFTFIEGFGAAMLTDFHLSALRSAALAGLAAAFSTLTSLLSLAVPSPVSPASLVTGPAQPVGPAPAAPKV